MDVNTRNFVCLPNIPSLLFPTNMTEYFRHQWRKTAVFSCNRCIIDTGIEKINNVSTQTVSFITRCLLVKVNFGIPTTIYIFSNHAVHKHLWKIGWLMACTACLVCLVSTVSGCRKNSIGRGSACSRHITKLEKSIFLWCCPTESHD